MKEVKLKSSAVIKVDDLNNIWYVSDIDSVLGKIDVNKRFNPIQGREFTAEMLDAIAKIMNPPKNPLREPLITDKIAASLTA